MAKRFYLQESESNGTTYIQGFHQIPEGAVEISEQRFLAVIANPPLGKLRRHDSAGLPILVDPMPLSVAERANAAYSRQFAAINLACESAITAGFTSDALGPTHYYSSQLEDQLNLTSAVLQGIDMPYPCRDESGLRDFRLHTAEQLRQVYDDFARHRQQLLEHAGTLKQQLDQALAAEDADAMELINWEPLP